MTVTYLNTEIRQLHDCWLRCASINSRGILNVRMYLEWPGVWEERPTALQVRLTSSPGSSHPCRSVTHRVIDPVDLFRVIDAVLIPCALIFKQTMRQRRRDAGKALISWFPLTAQSYVDHLGTFGKVSENFRFFEVTTSSPNRKFWATRHFYICRSLFLNHCSSFKWWTKSRPTITYGSSAGGTAEGAREVNSMAPNSEIIIVFLL